MQTIYMKGAEMKQIFDWMREAVNATIGLELFGKEYTGLERVNRIINEAEAKWEAECTCKGCAYENDTSEETECGHCKRAYSDCYEPIKIVRWSR